MCQQDPVSAGEPFRLEEGTGAFVVYSPDSPKHYMTYVQSSGYPLKMLELHSRSDDQVLATVFSYNLGKRFMVVFSLKDAQSI